jgi:pfkB family carbohydrate kinase
MSRVGDRPGQCRSGPRGYQRAASRCRPHPAGPSELNIGLPGLHTYASQSCTDNARTCRGQGRTPPARRDFGRATCAVPSRELCRSRIDANEKPVAESNLSLRMPAHVAAQCAMCQVVYMAEVVVFGVVAADVVLRVQRIPAPGDHVNAEALGWRIGGSSANVTCGLSTAGHHVRLVGPVGTDPMGENLLAELERCGVDTEYSFRADIASPAHPDTARRRGRAHDHRGGQRGRAVVFPARTRAGSEVRRLRLRRGLCQVPNRHSGRG